MKKIKKDILEALMSHPKKMLSEKEIKYLLKKHNNKNIENKLEKMKGEDILTIYSFKFLSKSKYPVKYYGFTEDGVSFVEDESIISREQKYKKKLKDKNMKDYWKASRPDYYSELKEKLEDRHESKSDQDDYSQIRSREKWYNADISPD